jgi:hypothetical protein
MSKFSEIILRSNDTIINDMKDNSSESWICRWYCNNKKLSIKKNPSSHDFWYRIEGKENQRSKKIPA